MSNVRMLIENAADVASLTVTPAPLTGMPAANMQNDRRAAVCRVAGKTMRIDINFDRPRKIGLIVLGRHNFKSTSTWRRQLWSEQNWTGTLLLDRAFSYIDPPVGLGRFRLGDGPLGRNRYSEWATNDAVDWITTQPRARSMRIWVNDPNQTETYMQVSRLLFGEYAEPLTNMSWGHKHEWADESEQARTEGGSLRADRVAAHRKITLRLDWNKAADAQLLNEISRVNGKKRDIFVSLYPGDADRIKERDYQMVTKLPEIPVLSPPFVNNFTAELTFVES